MKAFRLSSSSQDRRPLALQIYKSLPVSLHVLLVLFSLCVLQPVVVVQAQQAGSLTTQKCQIYLAASDVNRDDNLSKEPEYSRFVSVLTGSSYPTYAAIPAPYQALYDKYAATNPLGLVSVAGARPGSTATLEQSAAVTALCNEVIATVNANTPAPAPVVTTPPGVVATTPAPGSTVAVSVPFATCRISLAVSDLNRDNQLSQTEYITFLNRLTANRNGYTTFAALPPEVQAAYTSLAGGSPEIPIDGASPASFATATPVQKAHLETVCVDVQVAMGETPDAATTPPAVTLPPGTPATSVPAPSVGLTFPQCRISMAIADTNRNNELDSNEYVMFLNRLTRNAFINMPFTSLPPALQTNFNTLAAPTTTIDITGAQPAQFNTATDAQKATLQKICDDTQAITANAVPAVTTVPATTPPLVGTSSPAPGGGTITLLPFLACRARMAIADANKDNFLTTEEYSSFVNRLAPTVSYPTFASLPPNVQATYTALASTTGTGQINIYGAIPSQQSDAVQLGYLEKVCTDTQVALAGGPTLGPDTIVPSTAFPAVTTPPLTVTPITLAPSTGIPVPAFPTVPTFPPVTIIACSDHLRTADVQPRDNRLDQVEYPYFLAGLVDNWSFIADTGTTAQTYEMVPQPLKLNFAQYSVGGTGEFWDIAAVNPDPITPITPEQTAWLAQACAGTMDAINALRIASNTPPPTIPPKVYTPLPICQQYAAQADVDLNGQLSQAEYVTFCNHMSSVNLGPGGAPGLTFASLPIELQTAYANLAVQSPATTTVAIYTVSSPVTDALMMQVCAMTDDAIYTALYGNTLPPDQMPTPTPTPRPTFALEDCKADMVQIDEVDGLQDQFMYPHEYVMFVNLLSPNNDFANMLYDQLHPVLKENFYKLSQVWYANPALPDRLANPGAIDILGSLPLATVVVSEEQLQFLKVVCDNTTYAIQDALRPPTMAPTTFPTLSSAPTWTPEITEAPTPFDGEVEIYSSFIIYNRVGITEEFLKDPVNAGRQQLQTAYAKFCMDLVAQNPWVPPAATIVRRTLLRGSGVQELLEEEEQQQDEYGGRHRRLIAYTGAEILDVEYRDCPPEFQDNSVKEDCQTAYGKFKLSDVEAIHRVQVEEFYTSLGQARIAGGSLQDILTAAGSQIMVYGITPTLIVWTPPPTVSPTPAPDVYDFGRSAGSVLFFTMVGLLALIALGIYFAWNEKEKIKQKWREWKKQRKEQKGDEDQEGSQGELDGDEELQVDEDGNIIYPEGYEGYDEEDEFDDEYDEEGAEDTQGKKKGKRTKKLLGTLKGVKNIGKQLGLGDNEAEDDDIEIMQDENVLDFDDYIFDTPAELLTEQNGHGGNKMGDDANRKDALRDSAKARPALGTSFVAGANGMGDSVASSTSSMEGFEDFDEDFDDEYDSEEDEDSEDDDDDEDSFGLDFSDSEEEGDDEDTISSKGEDLAEEEKKDDDSLSSSDEQGANGEALAGGDVEGMLAAARANGEGGEDGEENDDENDDDDGSGSDGSSYGSDSTTSSLEELRKEVKELVGKVVPEELDNLSTMMDQFEGREAELINTLQVMEERNSTQRARAAVHKTRQKVNPNQVGGYSIASEGSAVIAAASTLGPEPQRRQPRVQQYDDYYDDDEGTYYSDEYTDEGTYYEDEEGTYYSGDEEYYDEEGTYYSGDEEGTYEDGEYYDDEEGTYYSGDEEGTYYSGDEEGYDDEEGTYYSGDEEGYDDDGYDDDGYGDEEGTYYSGDEEGTYEEGEYDDEEGTYYSGDEEGYDDDGYDDDGYGDEEGSYYSGDEGEGSYYSGEEDDYGDEGSYSGSYSDDDRG